MFDTFGDSFVGRFQGIETVTPENGDEPFEQALFRTNDGLFAMSGTKVIAGMRKVPPQTITRLTYVKDVRTNQASPMKDVKIETTAG